MSSLRQLMLSHTLTVVSCPCYRHGLHSEVTVVTVYPFWHGRSVRCASEAVAGLLPPGFSFNVITSPQFIYALKEATLQWIKAITWSDLTSTEATDSGKL